MRDEKSGITREAELERIYGAVAKPSLTKEIDHIHPAYRPFIEAAPFAALATSGPGGLDVSPRAIRQALSLSKMRRRCCCLTDEAITASIACAIFCTIIAWRCFF